MRVLRQWAPAVLVAVLGCVAAGYILVQQRLEVPGRDVYDIHVELPEADGVVPGLGQPVLVSGVKVGSITGAERRRGRALVTLTIDRGELRTVHADASAMLEPISPLKDMRLDLDPGRPSAPPMEPGGTIPIARASSPVPLSTLLSNLDADTRGFLTSLLGSTARGVAGRGEDMRRALRALGPSTRQLREVSEALATRRRSLARLVHNLSAVTRAASRDRELASLVQAGNATLATLADADRPLRDALDQLPETLGLTERTLVRTGRFAGELAPALSSLTPAVRRLPSTLADVRRFARATSATLSEQLRPLTTEARPLVGDLGRASTDLTTLAPQLRRTTDALRYTANTLAYNPPGNDEGGLFWAPWFAHNWNSTFGTADAHGGIGRAMVMLNCSQLTAPSSAASTVTQLLLGADNICPANR